MPKRGEHIHKRKDGRWEARYKCGISIAGKTLYKSVYAKTYAEVKEKQQKCMAEYRKGAIPERCVTFGSALALWQEVNKSRNKGATNMRYANLIDKHIAPELSNIRKSMPIKMREEQRRRKSIKRTVIWHIGSSELCTGKTS